MKTSLTAKYDDILFLVVLFVPVSLLLAGSFPLAAVGAI
jgi:hypothetical protein